MRHHALLKRKRIDGSPLWVDLIARVLYRLSQIGGRLERACFNGEDKLRDRYCRCELCRDERD